MHVLKHIFPLKCNVYPCLENCATCKCKSPFFKYKVNDFTSESSVILKIINISVYFLKYEPNISYFCSKFVINRTTFCFEKSFYQKLLIYYVSYQLSEMSVLISFCTFHF